ncbi:MAG: Wzz/FepE/Etk N-terminal domain-containing protein [Gemmatimonadota bacterium]
MAGTPAERGEVSFVSLANTLLRRRSLITWSVILSVVAVATLILLTPRTWTADTSFVPQGGKLPSNLSALASQFGVPLGAGGDAGESPNFYVELLQSRAILGTVVDSGVTVATVGSPVFLVDYYKSKGATAARRRDAAIHRLGDDVSPVAQLKTSVVKISVTMRSPEMAAAVAARLMELLNRFNLQNRRSRAGSERQFLEGRLAAVRRELREAEDGLKHFHERNRALRDSPELQFQQERLTRELNVQQQLFTSVVQAYEQAKIDEVRDTPVITVLERAEIPVRPNPRGLVVRVMVAAVGGLVFGIVLALFFQAAGQRDATSPDLGEFRHLATATIRDLRRPWRLLLPGSSARSPTPPSTRT